MFWQDFKNQTSTESNLIQNPKINWLWRMVIIPININIQLTIHNPAYTPLVENERKICCDWIIRYFKPLWYTTIAMKKLAAFSEMHNSFSQKSTFSSRFQLD